MKDPAFVAEYELLREEFELKFADALGYSIKICLEPKKDNRHK